ncbi:homodimeric glycerol 3-phosphate dehydrogenase (quinone) [Cyanobacterium stanieri PCC 7202]|uniref:Homodimeric glycerol 3-phosphate dehydrogenase (Quinone) n=1 Tax=Cyanobacterium stanieri (strain ATCC 29140 / PCC 7202) TaxID=292563 RepID=K9YRR3_CYASC|nr:homodimeric glycerol 3-phosphate dehydrogenase (quinone) [Cyanobacterium stanieri PCC 7202]
MTIQLIERQKQLDKLKNEDFDCLIIGGGATGTGSALEANSRGLKVALVERFDFASGTSSRSTKLLHGGVRYLEQAFKRLDIEQFNLVRDALSERKNVIQIAPHLAKPLPLIIPLYQFWQIPYFFTGLLMYDLLAGKQSLGRSRLLSIKDTLELFPSLNTEGMIASVMYYDGQFDDARLNVEVAMKAIEQGCAIANYLEVIEIIKEDGKCRGAVVRDSLTDDTFTIKSNAVVNATGPYSDSIRHLDQPEAEKILKVSSGVHIVVNKSYAPGDGALLIPKTDDGRVIFIVPWRQFTLIGTTDETAKVTDNPTPTEEEITYLMRYANRYLSDTITRDDVLSAWSGLRPLVSPDHNANSTAKISRDHTILKSKSGLITITGGKWTTFRKMAIDTVNHVIKQLPSPNGFSGHPPTLIPVAGGENYDFDDLDQKLSATIEDEAIRHHLINYYGSRAIVIQDIIQESGLERLAPQYPFITAEVIYVYRYEMAQKPEDILSRRFRLTFLDSAVSEQVKEKVNAIIDQEKSDVNQEKITVNS